MPDFKLPSGGGSSSSTEQAIVKSTEKILPPWLVRALRLVSKAVVTQGIRDTHNIYQQPGHGVTSDELRKIGTGTKRTTEDLFGKLQNESIADNSNLPLPELPPMWFRDP